MSSVSATNWFRDEVIVTYFLTKLKIFHIGAQTSTKILIIYLNFKTIIKVKKNITG